MAETEYEMRQVGDKTFIDFQAFTAKCDEIRALRETVAHRRQEIESLQAGWKNMQNDNAGLRQQVKHTEADLAGLRTLHAGQIETIRKYQAKENAWSDEKATLTQQIEGHQEVQASKNQTITRLSQQIETIRDEVKREQETAYKGILAARAEQIARLQSKCDKQTTDIGRWEARARKAEEQTAYALGALTWVENAGRVDAIAIVSRFGRLCWQMKTKAFAFRANATTPHVSASEPAPSAPIQNSATDVAEANAKVTVGPNGFITPMDSLSVLHATAQLQDIVNALRDRLNIVEGRVNIIGSQP